MAGRSACSVSGSHIWSTLKLQLERSHSCHVRYSRRAMSTSATRSYADALAKLDLLSSNKAVTSMFSAPEEQGKKHGTPSTDLNAVAIPEMLAWLQRAGYTTTDLARMRHIHVAGTKGKGSVCAYATAMLRRYGTVGTYTSPHLISPRERIAINGEPVEQEVFRESFFELWDRFTEAALAEGESVATAEGPASKPFFFRFLTILAWHIFLKRNVTNVVMECGIGGEFDATNILPPHAISAAVISQLGIDHVAMLGNTVEKIAWHKAGILKPGVKGFTINLASQPTVMDVLRRRAEEKEARLVEIDEADVEAWGGMKGILKGDFQKRNQALALLAVRQHLGLNDSAITVNPAAALERIPQPMLDGLQEAVIRGRCEVIQEENTSWLLDGAHTADSLDQVAKWIVQSLTKELNETVLLVFNQQERNASQLLSGFISSVQKERGIDDNGAFFSHAIFTRNDLRPGSATEQPRDLSIQAAAAAALASSSPHTTIKITDNIGGAVEEVKRLTANSDIPVKVVVTGSLHLVGGILQVLEPDSLS